jgi:hypothetical protein
MRRAEGNECRNWGRVISSAMASGWGMFGGPKMQLAVMIFPYNELLLMIYGCMHTKWQVNEGVNGWYLFVLVLDWLGRWNACAECGLGNCPLLRIRTHSRRFM